MKQLSFAALRPSWGVSFSLLFAYVIAHGILTDPRQRGALRLDNHLVPTIDWDAPTDYASHFPSGSKSRVPGSGTESVRRAAGNNWLPYQPLDRLFRWRAGVCGDEYGVIPQDHLRGGQYYHNGYRVREYVQGSIIFMESEIVTHHNGYFEFYICNIDACGDDISEGCFQEGHCQQLMRTPGSCDNGDDMRCGPIDPMSPGRWYLPCVETEPMIMGGWSRTIAYTLPRDLVCDHCVIQWYWVAANTCNVRGVHEYFTSPFSPNWGDCPGQGGSRGGWSANKPQCGGTLFPEEYWQCADVRIVPNPVFAPPPMAPIPPSPPPQPFAPLTPPFGQQSGETDDGSFAVSADRSMSEAAGFQSDGGVESIEEDHGDAADEGELETSESADQADSTGASELETSQSSDQEGSTEGDVFGADSGDSSQALSEAAAGTSSSSTDAIGNESQPSKVEQSPGSENTTSGAESVEPTDALGIHHSQV